MPFIKVDEKKIWDWTGEPFQLGDTVKFWFDGYCNCVMPRGFERGRTGIIIGHSKNGASYAVEFDEPIVVFGQTPYLVDTTCNGLGKQDHCWYMPPKFLQLVCPAEAFEGEFDVNEYL